MMKSQSPAGAGGPSLCCAGWWSWARADLQRQMLEENWRERKCKKTSRGLQGGRIESSMHLRMSAARSGRKHPVTSSSPWWTLVSDLAGESLLGVLGIL